MKLQEFIETIVQQYHQKNFLAIGITGSVAVGKSTFAKDLAKRLPHRVTVLSTDHFLMSNQELEENGWFAEKGFPQTYHLDQLVDAVERFRAGESELVLPLYEQDKADISQQMQVVSRPEILIVEGVTALQLPKNILDIGIFIEAKQEYIEEWYLKRTLNFIHASKDDPNSWYYPYSSWSDEAIIERGLAVWQATNQPNFDRFIKPSEQNADYIITKNRAHQVVNIEQK